MIPRIRKLAKKLRLGRPTQSVKLTLVHTRVLDRDVTFCVNMKNDPIQRNHRRGQFYEFSELARLRQVFPEGCVFVDIGANVGNHSLFAAMFLKAGRVIPFEPNPRAFDLLMQNMLVNGQRHAVDLTRLGVGISDVQAGGYAMQDRDRNLGGAKMLAGEGGLEVHRGDALLEDVTPDLIKIDVEGMEMAVLRGLSGVLARSKPLIMAEIDNENEAAFTEWMAAAGYGAFHVHQRYRLNRNHLIAPLERLEACKAAWEAETAVATEAAKDDVSGREEGLA